MNRVQQIQQFYQNRLRKSPDPGNRIFPELAVSDSGLFFIFGTVGQTHQIIQGDAVYFRQGDGGLNLRGRFPMLPGENGLLRDAEAVSEFDLRQPILFAQLFEPVAGHRVHPSFLYGLPSLYSFEL